MERNAWKIRVLVHNYARVRGVYAEHGLSLLIEPPDGEGALLFDTGQSGEVLLHNAERLGLDLGRLSQVVLSHGHYDHTGGLPGLLEAVPKGVTVTAHPAAFDRKLHGKSSSNYIGSPVMPDQIRKTGARLDLLSTPSELAPGLFSTGEVPRKHGFEEEAVKGFYVEREDGSVEPDQIPDDTSLLIDFPGKGFFLLCGCCHAGLINTLEHAKRITGEDRILGVLGGLHTVGASEERLERTFSALEELDPEALYPLHCAGERESVLMQERFPGRTKLLTVGESLEISPK